MNSYRLFYRNKSKTKIIHLIYIKSINFQVSICKNFRIRFVGYFSYHRFSFNFFIRLKNLTAINPVVLVVC